MKFPEIKKAPGFPEAPNQTPQPIYFPHRDAGEHKILKPYLLNNFRRLQVLEYKFIFIFKVNKNY